MSLVSTFLRNIARPSTKQLVCAGLFTLALAASVTLGVASRQLSGAAIIRDKDPVNSIDGSSNNGGIGAADPTEFIKDVRDNQPSDLQTIYADSRIGGLTPDKYDQFQREAVEGTLWRDGHITVNGQTVWSGVWTMGRTTLGNTQRDPITIGSKTYYHSSPEISFAKSHASLPVMVWFNGNGDVQMAVMNACGNGVGGGTKVHNTVTCKALNKTQPDATHKPNTYNFTTSVQVGGNAQISRVVYHFTDDNSTITKTGANAGDQAVEHTFAKDGDVTVTVFASVPGNHEIQAVEVADCKKHITFVPPFYVCTNLIATALDDKKKNFRFTVMVKTDTTGQTILQDVDFTLDGTAKTSGVTTKDAQGNVYKEYGFSDEVQHTVKASVNFNTAQGVQSVTCEASVTPAKTPKCTVPGHENEAPDSPKCAYCQPNIPVGDARCTPPTTTPPAQLVNTGPGSIVGTFVGTMILGFFGHKLFLSRRARRAAVEVA
jgi:hypothetical protein